MKRVLCFGDSNTWGFNYATGGRFMEDERWTGILQRKLGKDYQIIEEGLCGRTTVFNDPLMPGRNGLEYFVPMLCSHMPVDLLIMMLGTNDLKRNFSIGCEESILGMERILIRWRELLQSEQQGECLFLLISPIHIHQAMSGEYLYGFDERSEYQSQKFGESCKKLARQYNCMFMDASHIAEPSLDDGVHLDREGHCALGEYLAEYVKKMSFCKM